MPRSPEPCAAPHSELVGNDLYIRVQLELDFVGVAAPDVQLVEVGEYAKSGNRSFYTAVPALCPDLLASPIAELLVVSLALPKRQVSNFEMRGQIAILEQRGTKSCSKGNDHFDALTLN